VLTADHAKWRQAGIGGSDARVIAGGTAEEWAALKAEKIDGVRPVFTKEQRFLMDMGSAVEPIILNYLDEHIIKVALRNQPSHMKADPYFRCTLDGVTELNQPVECKFHTGAKDLDELQEFYWPQLQHELLVTGAKSLVFAVAFGQWGRFGHVLVEPDREFQNAYMMRALLFKKYCWEGGDLPEDLRSSDPQVIPQNVPRLRDHVWPASDNQIADLATKWLETQSVAQLFKEADAGLKKQVPEDCRSATWVRDGRGIKITVNKAGSKSIKPHVGTP